MAQPSHAPPWSSPAPPTGERLEHAAAETHGDAPLIPQYACYSCGTWNDAKAGAPVCSECGTNNAGFTTRLRVKPPATLTSARAGLARVLDLLDRWAARGARRRPPARARA